MTPLLLSQYGKVLVRDFPGETSWSLRTVVIISLILYNFLPDMHALPPEKVAELRAKIEAEREELKQKTDMAEEERNKAAEELEKREKDIQESE